ncbi:cytochrome o ubiquinol oxidase operon protein cyoD [Methylorubrum rhodinum]|jgi:cytochrome o ubiquinol oxidase operon protein cyoD|uniref:Cytochrome bo(3) ubiquinol oxidase subunit 4 n=1 Tax=Methylorubrum rhodinum TaxID=29428 RepID=A0A840ZHC0_9HYPH|nr:cytochrome o ubiquinol oxidase subunit IV [Methylorubrum rhodinum]MBB5756401.1 cytochrome o ubiquinol oxidase operon protein cyoD [Methylorubrum rhodinum]
MSGASGHADHGHGTHDHGAHGEVHGHGSFKDYVTGFVLSVILTAIPFWLVMADVIGDKLITGVVILAFAVVQIVVHMIYFLHMNTKSEGGWTFLALIFTVTIVAITLCGSIWVMHHLNTNMMPMTADDARHAP